MYDIEDVFNGHFFPLKLITGNRFVWQFVLQEFEHRILTHQCLCHHNKPESKVQEKELNLNKHNLTKTKLISTMLTNSY